MPYTPLCNMIFTSLLLAVTLIPPPISARPVASLTLGAHQNAFAQIDSDVIFDIAFSLALFIALLGSFAWLTNRWTAGAQPAEFFNGLYVAFSRQLSVLGRSAVIERATATFLDVSNANTAFVPRRGGTSYPVATVPWGAQAGGPRRSGLPGQQ
ncbi:hypothetical protein EI94DRAFT_1727899 [Lactarius quietus]|nr:hypothetical protein EI94DRAFT_1727899 [Lactarius quietus]